LTEAAFCFFAFFLALAFDLPLDLVFALMLVWPSLACVVVAALAGDVTTATGIAKTAALIKAVKSFFMVRYLLLTIEKSLGLRSDSRHATCPAHYCNQVATLVEARRFRPSQTLGPFQWPGCARSA